jgi:hypothetical protein
VRGDHPDQLIQVKIPEEESVAALKKEIKQEKSPCFDHIPADSLTLWNVLNESILADKIQDHVDALDLEDETLMPLLKLLGAEFPSSTARREYLHVVIKPPPPGEHHDHFRVNSS